MRRLCVFFHFVLNGNIVLIDFLNQKLGVAEALGCILSSVLVHFVGKRRMNFFSLTGTAACVFAVAAYAQARDVSALQTSGSEVSPSDQTWLPLIFVVGAAFFSHTGIRILPWMLIGK